MPSESKTKYPGVFKRTDTSGKITFYIRYRRGGRGTPLIKEAVGKASDGMTAAKANALRVDRMNGALSRREKARRMSCPAETRWTLARLWELYQELPPSPKGVSSNDIGNFKNYLSKPFGNKTADEISTMDVDRLCARLLQSKAPGTVIRILELMRRLFNFGKKKGLISIPGTLHFNMPRADNEKTEMLSDEQISSFLTALDEHPDPFFSLYMRFITFTGVRRTAALALRWEDCDFDRNFITLRGATAKNGKTKAIPMNNTVRALLLNIPHANGEFVFPQNHADSYTTRARKLADKAGLPKDFRPIHGLRHNFASRLASSGKVDLYTLQNLLTHSNPVMTQRYAHLADEALRTASMVADEVLMPKTTQPQGQSLASAEAKALVP